MPPWGLLVEVLVYGGLVPAAVAGGVLLVARRRPALLRLVLEPAAGGVALAGGFVGAYWSLGVGPRTPAASWHWLPYLAVGGAVVGLIETIPLVPGAFRWAARVLLAVAAA